MRTARNSKVIHAIAGDTWVDFWKGIVALTFIAIGLYATVIGILAFMAYCLVNSDEPTKGYWDCYWRMAVVVTLVVAVCLHCFFWRKAVSLYRLLWQNAVSLLRYYCLKYPPDLPAAK